MRLVSYGDVEIDLDGALLALAHHGRWEPARERLAQAMTAVLSGADVPAPVLRRAEEAFRRKRHLLASEDLVAWLAERELTVSDLRQYLRAEALADAGPAANPGAGADGPEAMDVPSDQLGGAARRWAVLGGVASYWAHQLANGAAAVDLGVRVPAQAGADQVQRLVEVARSDLGMPLEDRSASGLAARAALVMNLSSALEAARDSMQRTEVTEVIDEHRLAWTELDYSQMSLPSQGAALEALLCLNHDGARETEVAAMAGVALDYRLCRAEEVGAPLQGQLLSAPPRSAVGPVAVADGWAVAVLHSRRSASPQDNTVFERARETALEKKLERRLAGRAKWYAAAS